MTKENEFGPQKAAPTRQDEDEETLAAIDEGIVDADAEQTVSTEEVRKLLPNWVSAFTPGKER